MGQPENRTSTPITAGAAILLLLAAFIGLKPGGAGPENKEPGGKGPAVVLTAERTGKDPHLGFLVESLEAASGGPDALQETKKTEDSPATAWRAALGNRTAKGQTLDCFIATVPDPIDTPFGYWYDQIIESITRAVCDAEAYVPGKQWSPWEQFHTQATRHRAAPAATPAPVALFEGYPGVMLFHGKKDSRKTLAVLLVGETPKGVRAAALRRALDLAGEISGLTPPVTIRLVSPFFTGSFASLRQVVAKWKINRGKQLIAYTTILLQNQPYAAAACSSYFFPVKIDIITAAANGIPPRDVTDWIKDEANAHGRMLQFRSTVLPNEFLRNAAVHFLKKGAVDRRIDVSAKLNATAVEGVAFLVESNTGFGRAQIASSGQDDQRSSTAPPVQDDQRASVRGVVRGEKSELSTWPVFLPYPLHLARLQAKYAKQRLEKEKSFGLPSTLLPEAGKRSPRASADAIPILDEGTTSSITDRAVDDITSAIRRKRVRFVGILSTDPEDKVFLVERIRQNCPNVTLFITGNDLFYALPENRHIMRNVLISSTYPLTPFNQWWVEPEERRGQTFRSEIAQSYYNAAALHTPSLPAKHPEKLLQEYAPPVFTWNGDCCPYQVLPPAWILTVGETGQFVPLGYYNKFEHSDGRASLQRMASSPPPSEKTAVDLPGLGSFRVLLAVVFAAIGSLFYWLLRGQECSGFASKTDPKSPSASKAFPWNLSWWRAEMPFEEQPLVIYQGLALAAAVFSLLPLIFILLILLQDWFEQTTWTYHCLVLLLATAVILGLACLALQFRLTCRYLFHSIPPGPTEAKESDPRRFRRITLILLLIVDLVFLVALIVGQVKHDAVVKILYVERATSVLTGYSVLPPVLLLAAGFVAYAYFAVQRCYIGRRFRIDPPYPDPGEQFHQACDPLVAQRCHDICELATTVREELISTAVFAQKRSTALILGFVVYVFCAQAILFRSQKTWEGFWWDEPFAMGFFVLAALVLLSMWRLIDCWNGIQNILKKTALIPMVQAFDRLPRKTASLFGGYFFTRKPRAAHLAIPYHILEELREALLASGHISLAQTIAEEVNTPDGGGAPPQGDERVGGEEYPGDDINRLSRLAVLIVNALRQEWPRHSVADAFGEQTLDTSAPHDGSGGTGPTGTIPEWVKKAEDFVAIQAIIFLSQYFILLRALVASTVTVAMLLLLAASCYPFQPEKLILYVLVGLLATVAGSILYVLVQINQDEIISRITQSTPNRFTLNWLFVYTVLQYMGPIALLLAGHFSGRLRSLVEPVYQLLH